MEGQTAERVGLSAGFLVTCDRVSDPLRVNSDLILAPGFQFEFYLGVWLALDGASLKCLAMSCSELPSVSQGLLT